MDIFSRNLSLFIWYLFVHFHLLWNTYGIVFSVIFIKSHYFWCFTTFQEMDEFLWLQRLHHYRDDYDTEDDFEQQVAGNWWGNAIVNDILYCAVIFHRHQVFSTECDKAIRPICSIRWGRRWNAKPGIWEAMFELKLLCAYIYLSCIEWLNTAFYISNLQLSNLYTCPHRLNFSITTGVPEVALTWMEVGCS